jgi:hypothetical protein
MLSDEMNIINKKGSKYTIAASVATLFTLAIIGASTMDAAPSAAATAAATANNTTESSSKIELSQQPIYQDQVRQISETPINQTHIQSVVAGNGTLTLPNTTEPIRTTSSGNLIVSLEGTAPTAAGEQIVMTEDGSERATATLYEIARFNMQDGTGKGIAIAVVHTNSTGMLAPLNGMILAGQEEFHADGSRLVTMWEWESGIPLAPPQANSTSGANATDPLSVSSGGEAAAGGVGGTAELQR